METTATTWVQVAMRGRRAHLKMKKEKTAILKVTIKPTTHTHTHTHTHHYWFHSTALLDHLYRSYIHVVL